MKTSLNHIMYNKRPSIKVVYGLDLESLLPRMMQSNALISLKAKEEASWELFHVRPAEE